MLAGDLQPVFVSGECEIDLARRELRVLGSPVPVGARAFEIVEVLAQSAGELVTKDELMNRVWPGAFVNDNALQVHISAVRKALGPLRTVLKTESGRGYRLLGSWTTRDQGPARVAPQQLRVFEATPGTNIPAVAAGLVGRSTAIQRLRDFVSAYRVVTLTGPGGIGKTALALEVASGLLGEFEGAVRLVELASLSDPDLVPTAVASVLGLKLGGEEISAQAVARAVGETNLLLILDNCEHVINAAATLVETFVRRCPRTTIVATSRETLRIDGEYVYRVPPLEVPTGDEKEPDQILGHSAVELFIARAKALDSDFSPHSETLLSVAAICRHLDGIPLAIEFAAARAAILGVQPVAAGLHDRFAVLVAGRRTALPRHRTLRATLDWSYELLPEAERLLLRRLAIFAGGFTLEAAAAVIEDSENLPSIADGISNLITKSLVMLDHSSSVGRWRLLETIRAYALEKLAESGEAQSIARRHVEFYCDLFETAASSSRLQSLSENLDRFDLEIDNIRAALNWTFSNVDVLRLGIKLASKAVNFWLSTSLLTECCEWCTRALAHLGVDADTRDEMPLQCGLGISLIRTKGMTPEAEAALIRVAALSDEFMFINYQLLAIFGLWLFRLHGAKLQECLALAGRYEAIAKAFGTPFASATAEQLLGQSQYFLGEYASAATSLQRARAWYPMIKTARVVAPRDDADLQVVNSCYEAVTLWSLGFVDRAIRAREDALKEARDINHPISLCLALAFSSSFLLVKMGDLETAEHCINELIDLSGEHSLIPRHAFGLCAKGSLMAARGDVMSADRFLRDGLQRMRETGYRLYYAFFHAEWAMVLASSGLPDKGAAEIDAAQRYAEESQSLWCLPEVLRIKGEIFQKRDPADFRVIEGHFQRSQTLAHSQEGLSWELRAALSLARLRVTQGRRGEATQILAPVYDRFTEGFDTADLLAAKQLLDG